MDEESLTPTAFELFVVDGPDGGRYKPEPGEDPDSVAELRRRVLARVMEDREYGYQHCGYHRDWLAWQAAIKHCRDSLPR